MYHQDWLMRQIEAFVAFLIYMLTGEKDGQEQYVTQVLSTDDLFKIIRELIAQKQICKAEDMLFDRADGKDPNALHVSLYFYQSINQWSDSELTACNFSREEIMDGLKEICSCYQISDALLPFHFFED